jgi:hypothetical protein
MCIENEKRWRAADDNIQDDTSGEWIPEWQQYLLAIEIAKIRNEIPMSFEQWKESEAAMTTGRIPDPAA